MSVDGRRKKPRRWNRVETKLNDEELKLLDDYCDSMGVSRSDAIRRWVLSLASQPQNLSKLP